MMATTHQGGVKVLYGIVLQTLWFGTLCLYTVFSLPNYAVLTMTAYLLYVQTAFT